MKSKRLQFLLLFIQIIQLVYSNSLCSTQNRVASKDMRILGRSETLNKTKARTFNQSIGVMLRSYSRAIQLQESRSGSLFQKETKAICLSEIDGVSRAWFDTQFGTQINITLPEREYPQVCFNYIHSNPVVDGLVRHGRDWEFSSARDYEGIRNGKLVDRAMMTALGLEYRASL